MKAFNSLFLVGMILVSGSASSADETDTLQGIWSYKIRMLMGGAGGDIYTSFHQDGTCSQVMKGWAFGITKWEAYGCNWTSTSGLLSMTVTETPDQPALVGVTFTYQILSAGPDQLLLQKRDEKLEWNRVEAMPEAFEMKQQESLVADTHQGSPAER